MRHIRHILLIAVLTVLAFVILKLEIAIAVLLLSIIPALIARRKGRDAVNWWGYGVLLFPVALVASLLVKDTARTA